jgi:hypothetical protein
VAVEIAAPVRVAGGGFFYALGAMYSRLRRVRLRRNHNFPEYGFIPTLGDLPQSRPVR